MSTTERLNSALTGRYRIERQLGQGGMATVYLAQDVKHDRRVALKVLKPELSAVLGADRFVVEIKTTASLQHPHILPLFDSGSADGMLFYVMPYIEGETLRDKLNRETQLGIDEALRITTEVADALDYAHRHGVIHRDIKPENILLHDGRPVVADFGIALAVSAAAGGRMTETGLSLGTPHYMSPEQATAEKEISARSDIYSIASVLYEMLGGTPPHMAGSAQQIIMKIIAEPAEPVTKYRKTVPPHVAAALAKALEKLPADRFETAKAFADALRNPGFVATSAGTRSTLAAAPRPMRYVGGLVAAAIIGAVAMRLLGASRVASVPVYEQQTFSHTTIANARWAPDGKTILFTAAETAVPNVRIIRPEYPEPQLLLDSAHLLSISSKSEVALLLRPRLISQRIYEGTLAQMSLGGGAPRAIVDSVHEADWSPDGTTLAITRSVGAHDRIEYPVGTVLFEGPPGGYLSDLRISADGQRVAFMLHELRYDDRGWVAIVDRQGKLTRGDEEFTGMEGLTWDSDGQSVLFSASTEGDYEVRRWRPGSKAVAVLPAPGRLQIYDDRGGHWLVSRDEVKAMLVAKPPNAPRALDLTYLDHTFGAVMSIDGRLVAFSYQGVHGGGTYGVMTRKIEGGPAVRIGDGLPFAFSLDNKWVLAALPTSPMDVRWYPTGAGAPRPVKWALQQIGGALAMPDGKSLYVCGDEKGHEGRCYRSALDGSNLTPLTPEGLVGPPRPDYRAAAVMIDGQVFEYPFDGGKPRAIPGLRKFPIRYSPDGSALWVLHLNAPRHHTIDRVDVATGRRTPMFTLEELDAESALPGFPQIASDGKAYIYPIQPYSSVLYAVSGVR